MGISLTPYCYDWWITSAKKHIYKIKKLIRDYYDLEPGVPIAKYTELLKVSGQLKVYISRRALKHFVERRKGELEIRYTLEQAITRIDFVIDSIEEVVRNFDEMEVMESNRIRFIKHYYNLDRSSIRIVVEKHEDTYQIVSMHFHKTKKLPWGSISV